MSVFTGLDRGDVRLGVAGKILSAADAREALAAGADYVLIGRGAILHHDWPKLAAANPDFVPLSLPVTRAHLRAEGLGPAFVEYMNSWKGFVAAEEPEAVA
jgi:2,4-dienoyl-CoA reductase-like NADH-dependent reductase (Old Yellow Enzyme family)